MIYAFADALTGQSMATCFTLAMRLFSRVFVILAAISLVGCQNVSYYSQAISGQASLLWNSKAIEQVLKHPDTTPALRARLELVQEIRAYAVDALDLPESKSYQRYTDIGRDFVLCVQQKHRNVTVHAPHCLIPAQSNTDASEGWG